MFGALSAFFWEVLKSPVFGFGQHVLQVYCLCWFVVLYVAFLEESFPESWKVVLNKVGDLWLAAQLPFWAVFILLGFVFVQLGLP